MINVMMFILSLFGKDKKILRPWRLRNKLILSAKRLAGGQTTPNAKSDATKIQRAKMVGIMRWSPFFNWCI